MGSLVIRNGAVLTAAPGATAVAVVDGRIAAVGDDAAVAPYVAHADRVLDLDGRLLIPGFTDAHVHAIMGGIERNACDLTAGRTLAEYRATVAAFAAAHPADDWIRGGGWSMEAFPQGLPRREILDELLGARPAFLPNRDHHSAWVSTEALRRAGIDATTPDPDGGRIERDADGTPTGALHESAMDLVEAVIPPHSQDTIDAGLRTAVAHLLSLGITGWQDAWVSSDLSQPSLHHAYRRADAEGWLHAKVSGALWWERDTPAADIDAEVARLAAIRDRTNAAGGRYGIHSVKVMQDGVAETFTASMLEPYLDTCGCATDNSGISFLAPELLARVVTALDAAGFQIHSHALGDRAVRDVLDAIESARRVNGARDARHHLAHVQFIDPRDIERFPALGVTANLQALWAAHEPQLDALTAPFVGDARAARVYPFGELLRAGASLAMGSDWPVSSANPLDAIHVAVNRIVPHAAAGTPALGRGQALPLEVALQAYTAGSAWLNRRDDTGVIQVGAAADLVVLDRDILARPVSEIASAQVDHTFIDGSEVYARES